MPSEWMPGATRRLIPYAHEAGSFTIQPLGWILHVTDMNGSPYRLFADAKSPHRRFSHLWVSKVGEIEQYQPFSMKSWAQEDGNATYWSVETEGFPDQPLNALQIRALAKIHKFLGTEDKLANAPGQRGIGTHYMGYAAWGAHSCPDPVGKEGQGPRSHQRQAIIDYNTPPQPKPPKGKKMLRLIEPNNAGPIYLVVDALYVRWIHNPDELHYLQALLEAYGFDNTVHVQDASLVQSYGILLGEDAPGSVVKWYRVA